MRVDDFDFQLPEELIALRPARPRDSARLLVVRGPDGDLEDRLVSDLPELLRAGDILVANDTRVMPAALLGARRARGPGGPAVHFKVNLHRRLGARVWAAFVRPGKRLKLEDRIYFRAADEPVFSARVIGKGLDGEVHLAFDDGARDLAAALDRAGDAPLPPYISGRRPADADDRADYQTVFASGEAASVAAPTAGLHFTFDLLVRLRNCDVTIDYVRLDVGGGTFLPVKADLLVDHYMHPERCVVSAATATAVNMARNAGGRCIPVGTTALRALETAAGADRQNLAAEPVSATDRETSIFIWPGYRFRASDGLMTNFHLPRSTLFMLVSAMMGLETMQRAYAHAISAKYRFYSYGDACLLLPHG